MASKGKNTNLSADIPYRVKSYRVPIEDEAETAQRIRALLKEKRREIRERRQTK